jgi:hypothetical protein
MLKMYPYEIISDSEFFDWYQKWEDLRPHISSFIEKSNKILNLGCGLSSMI